MPIFDGVNLFRLPRSETTAASAGCPFFFTGQPCVHGHVAPKYTKGGRCLECSLAHAQRQRDAAGAVRRNSSQHRILARVTRAIAGLADVRTYTPALPCKHGHSLRWVATNNCVECDIEARARRRSKARDVRLQKLYGITATDFDALVVAQDCRCKICRTQFEDSRLLHVDHDHATGKVRGLLCSKCNQALGLFDDSVDTIEAAGKYLRAA